MLERYKMQDRIREILSWYGSDNPGTLTNLARLLNHGALGGTGKLVILPVDQGVEHGPGRSFAPNPPHTIRAITLSWPLTLGLVHTPPRSGSSKPARATTPAICR